MIPPCLTLSDIRYVSRVKWSNQGKVVARSLTPWCCSYWKGSFLVAVDYDRQLYFTYKYARACVCVCMCVVCGLRRCVFTGDSAEGLKRVWMSPLAFIKGATVCMHHSNHSYKERTPKFAAEIRALIDTDPNKPFKSTLL